MDFVVKSPIDCTDEMIAAFIDLVKLGGQVDSIGLKDRVISSKYLGFCYVEQEIVAISALKRPNDSYINRVLEKAQITKALERLMPLYELGYSYTSQDYRKKGINQQINNQLLDRATGLKVLATTSHKSMKSYLKKSGFTLIGKPYNGNHNEVLECYIKE